MSSKGLLRRLSRLVVVTAASTVVLASGAGMSAAYAAADHSTGTAGTSGVSTAAQPLSTADMNTGGANGGCTTDPKGIYCSTRDGSASGNGNQTTGGHNGEPCAGCVGKADNKNPPGQEKTNPLGTFPNNGYECDHNNGIGKSNPAHTGCTGTTPPPPTTCSENSFFLGQTPASGATVKAGDTLSVFFSDESPLGSGAFAPVLTIDGVVQPAGSLTITPVAKGDAPKGAEKYTDLLSYTTAADLTGTHTFAIKAFDTDQNKPGGDCGTATWTLTVTPPAVTQTLTGHIYDCTGGTATTSEVPGGTLSASGTGLTAIASQPNPILAAAADAGTYTLTGTAPAGYEFVSCGHNDTPDQTSVVVPAGGNGTGILYVAPVPAPPTTQTLAGHIYDCSGGTKTTNEVSGGTLAATGPTTIASQPNPIFPAVPVDAGTYTMTGTAPSGYTFVRCHTKDTPGTTTVKVPAGGSGVGILYVAAVPTPPTSCAETVLFDQTPPSGATVNPGDTVSALYQDETAIGSTGAFAPTLTIDGVVQPAGSLTITPEAGTHHDTLLSFVIPAAYGDGATHTFSITAFDTDQNKPGGDCGTFTWTLKVKPPPAVTQTLTGHIYDCAGGTATTSEVPGGTLSASGAGLTAIASQPNPILAAAADAGTYTLTGTAPSGYEFVSCDVNDTPNQTSVVIPAGGTGTGALYVAPITQTLSAVIDLCSGDMAPSTGSLLTIESTTAHSTNPLAASDVAAGDQTVDAVAPTGYHFVDCHDSTQHILTPGTATETVNVPAGSTGTQAVFYVEKNETPPPPPVLSMTVDKTNDANGDTIFSKSETAPSAGATVPFQVVVTNTSTAVEVIDSISDSYAAVVAAECPELVGTEIQPAHSVTCSFSIDGYSPAAGTSLTNTVTVTVHAKGDTGDTLTGTSTSTVTTAAPPPPVLTVNVDKTNNADGVAGFHKTETATSAGQAVPFQVVISNPTGTDEVIDSITDAYGSTTAAECGDLVGTTLAAHDSVTCTFTIPAYSPAAGGSLTDTVTVVVHQLGNSGNSTTGQSSSTVLTPATPPALSLTVVKSNDANLDGVFHDTESATAAGQDVTFQVTVVNNSPVAVVIDSAVDAFSGATHDECASLVGTTLASGATATCSFTIAGYSPAAGGSLTDLVTVIGHEVGNPGNSTQGNDTSTVLTPSPVAAGAPDLAIVKTASKTSVKPGDAFDYTLTVTNVGDAATDGAVTVTDVVPSGLAVTGVNGGSTWSCSTSGQTVSCTYTGGPITPGTTVAGIVVSTTVLSSASGTLTNTGVVKTPGDTNPTNDTSTVKTPVTKVLGEKIPKTPGTPGTPGAPHTPSSPSVGPSVLPFTGSNVTALLPLAVGFMTVGLLMVVAGVRRRRA